MRVGILSQWFPPETGPASIPGVLAKGLVERGHEVTVLTGFPNYPTGATYDGFKIKARMNALEYGYDIRRVALYPDHSDRVTGRLANYASFAATASTIGVSALRGIDVLWVYNSPASVALPMWVAGMRYKAPVVLHVMDLWPDSILQTGFGSGPIRRLLPLVQAWVSRMYSTASVVGYLTPSAGLELHRRGVPKNKLVEAPLWSDDSVFFPADGSRLRSELGYTDDDIVVGYAGALGHGQQVSGLARAIAQLPAHSRVRGLFLGAGTEEAIIRSYADRYPGRIKFIGTRPHQEMTQFGAVPDISFVGLSGHAGSSFTSPSKFFSIIASGKPVLSMTGSDTDEIVRDADIGYVCEDPDRLGPILLRMEADGHENLRRLGARAHLLSRTRYSTRAGIERVESMLLRAAEAGRS